MDKRIKHILTSKIYAYFFNCDLKTTIKRLNNVFISYNSFINRMRSNKLFLLCDNLIYTNILDMSNTYRTITYNELKSEVVTILDNFILDDFEYLINYTEIWDAITC